MARWARPVHRPPVPARLLVFDESDWGPEDGDPQKQWRAARHAWNLEHGFTSPGPPYPGSNVVGPLGDPIEQINAWRAVRRNWPGP